MCSARLERLEPTFIGVTLAEVSEFATAREVACGKR